MEQVVAGQLDRNAIDYSYEDELFKIPYVIPSSKHTYLPDFAITTKSGKKIIIEAKGIWNYEDRYKHLLIRKAHPEIDLRFVFQRAKSKIRKGSTTTYADICNGLGRGIYKGVVWKFGDNSKIPKEWYDE